MKYLLFFLIFLGLWNIVEGETRIIKLPEPRYKGNISVEEALLRRRSIRSYKDEALSLKEISQILWSAQGITDKRTGFRTAPSAGALYPLEIYLVAGKVKDLEPGVYKYKPETHEIILVLKEDKRNDLYISALRQEWIKNAPIVVVISAVFERTTVKYGERGIRYVYMEAGHCSQNIYLQCVSLNLGTVAIGAFYDEEVKRVLNLQKNESPLYLMPIGKI
ncbi:MAG: SagB/ThcOx family dehydrogenase [Dictyoglomaceae bacterium]